MTTQDTLRLDRLTLKNFRCFSECTIELHPQLTVLVADNGSGKTAILDAIAVSLGLFVDTLAGGHPSPIFDSSDAHRTRTGDALATTEPHFPVSFSARGWADGQNIGWQRSLARSKKRGKMTVVGARLLTDAAAGISARLQSSAREGGQGAPPPRSGSSGGRPPGSSAREAGQGAPLLPAVVFYGTGRLWSHVRLTARRRSASTSVVGRVAGYLDCLSPSSSFNAFVEWYKQTWASINAPRAPGLDLSDRPQRLIAAVEEAVRTVLAPTGWHQLDVKDNVLVVSHPQRGTLPLAFLSDGVRNMIALVADLAHRCVRLNPHFGVEAARSTPGIVLIDEVDMHLHPGWQQTVIELLLTAFPRMQFVVTTHSPQVLSTVNAESIRVLHVREGVGVLETPQYQTRGVESADVLAVIMGIDPVPQVPEAKLLSEYRKRIEDGQAETPEARTLREALLDHFGPQHPLMLDCDRLMRFQAFKLRRAAGGGH